MTVNGELNGEKTNASQSQKPNFYYAKHMQPGTCRYDKEMILVDTDAMQKMIGTGPGIPVYIHHQVAVPLDEVKEKAAGYVTESFYNELDGWAWFKVMAIDDEIRLAVSNKWSVSNAYRPVAWGEGGTKNNVPYDREITNAEFTHLAIVPNPRYEDACIMSPEEFRAYQEIKKAKLAELQNSNPSLLERKNTMFNFLRKENKTVSANEATHVEVDGKEMTIDEFQNAVKKNAGKKNEGDAEKNLQKDDKKDFKDLENENVDVQGTTMTVKDLVNKYTALTNEKKNAEDEKAKKEKEDKEAEEKKNAEEKAKKDQDDENIKKAIEEEKTNGKKFFDELVNANTNANPAAVTTIDTGINMTERGQQRYGSAALK